MCPLYFHHLLLETVVCTLCSQAEAVLHHPHVEVVELIACRTGRLAVRCNTLRSLHMPGTSITVLNPTCPNLRTLDLSGCTKLTDAGLRSGLARLPALTELDLSGGVPVSDDTLREVGPRQQASLPVMAIIGIIYGLSAQAYSVTAVVATGPL